MKFEFSVEHQILKLLQPVIISILQISFANIKSIFIRILNVNVYMIHILVYIFNFYNTKLITTNYDNETPPAVLLYFRSKLKFKI